MKNHAWVSENEKAHGDNWRKWLGHLKDKPAIGLELGTWLGESAEWMLDNIFTHRMCRYHCVDTFKGSEEHHLAGIDCSMIYDEASKRLERFGGCVTLHVNSSDQFLRDFKCRSLDFVYVDAAHDAMNVMRDSVLAFDLLREGGIMIWDDYDWHVMPDEIDCPKLAVDSFIQCYGRRLEVIGMGYQVAVRKLN